MLAPTAHDELDAGPHKGGPGGERLCALTRKVKPVEQLIRFVLGPQGIVPDLKRKLPGRGIWLTADKAAVNDAVARKVFARGFKRDVQTPPDLADLTERLLLRSALDALAIAGKAGLAVSGYSRIEAALARDKVVCLLHAGDAGADGTAKLKAALQRRADAAAVAVVTIFSSAQLDLALGRPNMVHAALLAGPASERFLARLARLMRFRLGETGDKDGRDRPTN
jgi:predicted RNA-binding protein YlxR (DUF448 family)